jgi:chromosome segregation ATPase
LNEVSFFAVFAISFLEEQMSDLNSVSMDNLWKKEKESLENEIISLNKIKDDTWAEKEYWKRQVQLFEEKLKIQIPFQIIDKKEVNSLVLTNQNKKRLNTIKEKIEYTKNFLTEAGQHVFSISNFLNDQFASLLMMGSKDEKLKDKVDKLNLEILNLKQQNSEISFELREIHLENVELNTASSKEIDDQLENDHQLENKLLKTQDKIGKLLEKEDEYILTVETLKGQNELLKTDLEKESLKSSQIINLKHLLSQGARDYEKLQKQYEDKKIRNEDLEGNVLHSDLNILNYKNKIEKLKKSLNFLDLEHAEKTAILLGIINELEIKNENISDEVERLNLSLIENQNHKENFNNELNRKSIEFDKIRSEFLELNEIYEIVKSENNELNSDFKEVEEELENIYLEFEELDDENKELTEKFTQITEYLELMEENSEALEGRLNDQKGHLNIILIKDELTHLFSLINKNVQIFSDENIDDLNIDDLKNQLKETIDNIEKDLILKNDQEIENRENIEKIGNILSQLDYRSEEIEKLQSKYKEMNEEKERVENEYLQMVEQFENLEKELKEKDSNVASSNEKHEWEKIKDEKETLEKEYSKLKDIIEKLEDSLEEKEKIEKEYLDLKNIAEGLENNLKEKENSSKEFEDKHESVLKEKEKIEVDFNNLKEKFNILQDEYNENLKILSETTDENSEVSKDDENSSKTVASLKSRNEELQEEIRKAYEKMSNSQDRGSDDIIQIKEQKENLSIAVNDLQNEIIQLSENMREKDEVNVSNTMRIERLAEEFSIKDRQLKKSKEASFSYSEALVEEKKRVSVLNTKVASMRDKLVEFETVTENNQNNKHNVDKAALLNLTKLIDNHIENIEDSLILEEEKNKKLSSDINNLEDNIRNMEFENKGESGIKIGGNENSAELNSLKDELNSKKAGMLKLRHRIGELETNILVFQVKWDKISSCNRTLLTIASDLELLGLEKAASDTREVVKMLKSAKES